MRRPQSKKINYLSIINIRTYNNCGIYLYLKRFNEESLKYFRWMKLELELLSRKKIIFYISN